MRIRITILAMVLATFVNAATPFQTPRLEKIAKAIGLLLPDSITSEGVVTDGLAYKGRRIYAQSDSFGDISHIGYKIFDDSLTGSQCVDAPIFRFLERYLLELDLGLDGRTYAERMDIDQVSLVRGTIDMLRKVNTSTNFSLNEIPRRMYRIVWNMGGKEVALTFPSDCQLIKGANAIELEQMAEKAIRRVNREQVERFSAKNWNTAEVARSKGMLVVEGDFFISEMIRNDIFLTEDENGNRQLVCDENNPAKSVSNIMLTGVCEQELPMVLRFNKYGQQTDTLQITLQQFLTYCRMEGCRLYFGVKTINEKELAGTVLALNEKLGYDHLLSVRFPLGILRGEVLTMTGTSYLYIPLHKIKEEFFNQFKDNDWKNNY